MQFTSQLYKVLSCRQIFRPRGRLKVVSQAQTHDALLQFCRLQGVKVQSFENLSDGMRRFSITDDWILHA
jgi:ABC-type multidrug transport system ATPase subunit